MSAYVTKKKLYNTSCNKELAKKQFINLQEAHPSWIQASPVMMFIYSSIIANFKMILEKNWKYRFLVHKDRFLVHTNTVFWCTFFVLNLTHVRQKTVGEIPSLPYLRKCWN